MAEGDRPDDMPPGGKSEKPRRPPPVIELEAKELGEDGGKAQPKPKPEPAPASAKPDNSDAKSKKAGMNLAAFLPSLIAGAIGAAAGAAIVFFALPQFGQPAGPQDASLSREIAALNARIETLSKRPAAEAENPAIGQRIDKLAASIANAEKRLSENETRGGTTIPGATADSSADAVSRELREALAELRKIAAQQDQPAIATAIQSLTARIGALDERVSSLTTASKSSVSSEIAREILALNTLSAAINSGKPFVQELAAARAATGSRGAALDALEKSSAKGIPAVGILANQFSALAPKLLRGTEDASGFISRLYANATRLVEVRKIGDGTGDGPEAVVARMESALTRGDLVAAVSEFAKLPERSKSEASSWIATANERFAAETTVRKLIETILVSPEQPKS